MTDVLRGRLTTLYAAMKSETLPACQFLPIAEGLNNIARWFVAAGHALWQPSGNRKPRLSVHSALRRRPAASAAGTCNWRHEARKRYQTKIHK